MARKEDRNVKDGKATSDGTTAKDAPSIAGPRTHVVAPKREQIVSTLASLKEDPEEDAITNSTEDLDSIARDAARLASPLRKNPGIERAQSNPDIARSRSFNTSLSDEAEPDAKGEQSSLILLVTCYPTKHRPINTLCTRQCMLYVSGLTLLQL